MKFLYATISLLCGYVVAAKFRIDGGEDANFNNWPFVCAIHYQAYGTLVTDPSTGADIITHPTDVNISSGTCTLIKFRHKYYVLTAAHLLGSQTADFINNNLVEWDNIATFVSGFVIVEFGSAHKGTVSQAIIKVDRNNLKLPLQFVDSLRNRFNLIYGYDFLTLEIHNHQWYEQRNGKFLDILRYGYYAKETLLHCKIAAWGNHNGDLAESLQQTFIHMFDRDKCNFYLTNWARPYRHCMDMRLEMSPVCYDTSPSIELRSGDSGSPVMCVNGRQTLLTAIHVATFPAQNGRLNITIRVGAPFTAIIEFLALIQGEQTRK